MIKLLSWRLFYLFRCFLFRWGFATESLTLVPFKLFLHLLLLGQEFRFFSLLVSDCIFPFAFIINFLSHCQFFLCLRKCFCIFCLIFCFLFNTLLPQLCLQLFSSCKFFFFGHICECWLLLICKSIKVTSCWLLYHEKLFFIVRIV